MNNPVKVQYGCGLSNPSGWKNFDSTPTLFIRKIPLSVFIAKFFYKLLKNSKPNFSLTLNNIIFNKAIYGDITKKLPIQSETVDYLYASHVLEHLPFKEFRKALKESYRVLKKGGVFRVVVPNFYFFIQEYLDSTSKTKSIDFCLNTLLGAEYFENIFNRMRGGSKHNIMFDYETLENELKNFKFSLIRKAKYNDSEFEVYKEIEDKDRWIYPENIGFECIK